MTVKMKTVKTKDKVYLIADIAAAETLNPGQDVSRVVVGYFDTETMDIEEKEGMPRPYLKLKQ